jgi:hypothetical protein
MKLNSFSVSNVSTVHISKTDNEVLEKYSKFSATGEPNHYPITVLRYFHGFMVEAFIWNKDVGMTREDIEENERAILAAGHSEAFVNLLGITGRQGHKWLCLDADGDKYEDLPKFKW